MAIQSARFLDSVAVTAATTPSFTSLRTYSASDSAGSPLGLIAILTLSNYTNQSVEVSFDGTNVHIFLRAGEQRVVNFRSGELLWVGRVWTRHGGVAPTTGNFYLEAIRSSQ